MVDNISGLLIPPSISVSITSQSGVFQFPSRTKRTMVITQETPSSSLVEQPTTKKTAVPCVIYNNKDSCMHHGCKWYLGKCIDPPMCAPPKEVIPRPYERQR